MGKEFEEYFLTDRAEQNIPQPPSQDELTERAKAQATEKMLQISAKAYDQLPYLYKLKESFVSELKNPESKIYKHIDSLQSSQQVQEFKNSLENIFNNIDEVIADHELVGTKLPMLIEALETGQNDHLSGHDIDVIVGRLNGSGKHPSIYSTHMEKLYMEAGVLLEGMEIPVGSEYVHDTGEDQLVEKPSGIRLSGYDPAALSYLADKASDFMKLHGNEIESRTMEHRTYSISWK